MERAINPVPDGEEDSIEPQAMTLVEDNDTPFARLAGRRGMVVFGWNECPLCHA